MTNNKKENQIIEEDEINLIDLIKVIYKWRYYSLVVIISITLFGVFFGLKKYKNDPRYTSYSIIQPATFNDKNIIDNEVIIQSIYIFNDVLKKVDKNLLYKELNINKNNLKNYTNTKLKNILFRQWLSLFNNRITIKDNKITYWMYSKEGVRKIGEIIEEDIILLQRTKLKNKFNEYLASIKKIVNQLSSATAKKNIYIQNFSIPIITQPEAVISIKNNFISGKRTSAIKYVIIFIFIGIFIGLIIPFIIEFFYNIDFSQIKNG